MPAMLNKPEDLDLAHLTHGVYDDFNHYVTADTWSTMASNSGAVTAEDLVGGVIKLDPSESAGVDNDETYIKGTKENFLFAANKPLALEAMVKFTEANTDDANILVGLMNAVAANSILDDGAGPAASFSGAVFYKVDGGTRWRVRSSIGTTYTDNQTNVTAGAAYQRLRIEAHAVTATEYEITYFIDGVQCRDYTTGLPICHRFAFSGATEMQLVAGVKNGGANLETLYVDYFGCWQKR